MAGMRRKGDGIVTQHFRGLVLAAALMATGVSGAQAQFNQSEYTDLNLDLCTVVQSDDFGSTWACNGFKGIPVMVAEGDLRLMVSYGLTSTEERPRARPCRPSIIWAERSSGDSPMPRAATSRSPRSCAISCSAWTPRPARR